METNEIVQFIVKTSHNKIVCECDTHSKAIEEKERIETKHGELAPRMHIVSRTTTIKEVRLDG